MVITSVVMLLILATQIIFIILRLINIISWHWAFVMLPTEISVGAIIITLIIGLISAMILMGKGYSEDEVMEDEKLL